MINKVEYIAYKMDYFLAIFLEYTTQTLQVKNIDWSETVVTFQDSDLVVNYKTLIKWLNDKRNDLQTN